MSDDEPSARGTTSYVTVINDEIFKLIFCRNGVGLGLGVEFFFLVGLGECAGSIC